MKETGRILPPPAATTEIRKSETAMSANGDDIDWSLTTWEGSRRAQLRRALTMTVRERLEAAEGLADVARRFAELRARGALQPAREPPPPGYEPKSE